MHRLGGYWLQRVVFIRVQPNEGIRWFGFTAGFPTTGGAAGGY